MSNRGRGGGGGTPRGRGGQGGFPGGRGGGGRGRGEGPVSILSGSNPAQNQSRLIESELESLAESFNSVKIESQERPLRPGWGKAGTHITLRANFFSMGIPSGPIYDYIVEISPRIDFYSIKRRLFEILERNPQCQPHLPYISHDGSQRLVSARRLPQPLDVVVPFYVDDNIGPEPNSKVYLMSIKYRKEWNTNDLNRFTSADVRSRDYNVLPIISALNLILKQHARQVGTRVGKNWFFTPLAFAPAQPLSPGLEAIQGSYTSVRPAYRCLQVNVNACMTAFITPGRLSDLLTRFAQDSRGSSPNLPRNMLKSIRVRITHLGYQKRLNAIGPKSARETVFYCNEPGLEGSISVEAYYLHKYGIILDHPDDLPVVDVGNTSRTIWIPAELCIIEEGNVYRGRSSDEKTARMTLMNRMSPQHKAQAIMINGLNRLGFTNPPQGPLSSFGITVRQNMSTIPGRELDPPLLNYKVGKATVRSASWNILNVKFRCGALVPSIWVLVVQDYLRFSDSSEIWQLMQGFTQKLADSGVVLQTPGPPRLLPPVRLLGPYVDPDRVQSLNVIKRTLQTAMGPNRVKPGFVVVLLQNRDNDIYAGIKKIGDVELGIHTIHMQMYQAHASGDPRKQDQYFSNVALKVNTKLGGINHLLEDRAMTWLTKKTTMMVGIDMTSGRLCGSLSIAAVVASMDDNFVQFPASLRIQKTKKEMVDELTDMMVERLLYYQKKNKALPERVIVYCNGISEGQINTVLQEEVTQILESFKKLNTKDEPYTYRPRLSVIIWAKGHHARFFPTNQKFTSANGNTRPGTVVDKGGIGGVGVFDFGFHLQPHSASQGHVKLTRYTVIYDEIGLQADEIQQGTHDLSYLYARATNAVSVVPVACYAKLACKRGRCYLNNLHFLDDDAAAETTSGLDTREEEANRVFERAKQAWGAGLHADIKDSMFYI